MRIARRMWWLDGVWTGLLLRVNVLPSCHGSVRVSLKNPGGWAETDLDFRKAGPDRGLRGRVHGGRQRVHQKSRHAVGVGSTGIRAVLVAVWHLAGPTPP